MYIIKKIVFNNNNNPNTINIFKCMFSGFKSLEEIDISSLICETENYNKEKLLLMIAQV